jgi:hypothetical protein
MIADDGDDDSDVNAELELLSRGGLGAPAEVALQVLSRSVYALRIFSHSPGAHSVGRSSS